MDDDGNKKLNLDEFNRGLQESGLELSEEDIQNMFTKFDTDNDGNISVDEFIAGIRVSVFSKLSNLINYWIFNKKILCSRRCLKIAETWWIKPLKNWIKPAME